jgi:hypothetical protein
VHASVERGKSHLVLVVDVGDDRHRRAGHDVRQSFGRFDLVARAPHDVRAGGMQRVDLRKRSFDVCSLGDRHRLHRDRGVAPDLDGMRGMAKDDLACGPTLELSVDEHQTRLSSSGSG